MAVEVIAKGQYVLEVPRSGTAIDGARENCLSCAPADGTSCLCMFVNHSVRPNARFEHWPATAGGRDRMMLVSSERMSVHGTPTRAPCYRVVLRP